MRLATDMRRLSPQIPGRLNREFRRLIRLVGTGTGILAFAAVTLVAGIGSAWYAVDRGTPWNSERYGSWLLLTEAGQPDADPYTRARRDLFDGLALASSSVLRFEARHDSAGRRLYSSCEYVVSGTEPPARWWTIAVFDANGRLIANPSERHGYNSATVATGADGIYRISLARDARPGNWLPTAAGGYFVVVLEVQEPDAGALDATQGWRPPRIERVQC